MEQQNGRNVWIAVNGVLFEYDDEKNRLNIRR